MNRELSSRKQVAIYFGVSVKTVQNWQKDGTVKPFCIINGRPRYDIKAIIEALPKKGGVE